MVLDFVVEAAVVPRTPAAARPAAAAAVEEQIACPWEFQLTAQFQNAITKILSLSPVGWMGGYGRMVIFECGVLT